eukprot:1160966-Pelagomonas_calceolata.AAC.9
MTLQCVARHSSVWHDTPECGMTLQCVARHSSVWHDTPVCGMTLQAQGGWPTARDSGRSAVCGTFSTTPCTGRYVLQTHAFKCSRTPTLPMLKHAPSTLQLQRLQTNKSTQKSEQRQQVLQGQLKNDLQSAPKAANS